MKRILIFVVALLTTTVTFAQEGGDKAAKYEVEMPSFWTNWYVQVGLDMSLQNPYGRDFSDVFPNGKTFGINAALGRWFTPALGLRAKVNWENGIGLFENGHANWLAPFYEPGKNMDRGGYMTVTGDIQVNIHNLFWGYEEERLWNLIVYPRAGIDYNFGVSKGSPLLGLGIQNTFRLDSRYLLYLDISYNGVSSGHTGVEKSTGIGSNSNGFFVIECGVQFNLGNQGFKKVNQ
ncbi:pAP2 domain protein [Prevotella sp. CAG:1058]|nr:pAP2 domain protein [Prevotella sp. CAG:1058]